jgi:hypothetical protein
MAATNGAISGAVGITPLVGVHRSGSAKMNPASPSVPGNAPRSLARLASPLAEASIISTARPTMPGPDRLKFNPSEGGEPVVQLPFVALQVARLGLGCQDAAKRPWVGRPHSVGRPIKSSR